MTTAAAPIAVAVAVAELLRAAATVIEERGVAISPARRGAPVERSCRGTAATATDYVCLVCAMCVAAGSRPGVITEPVKDAMYEVATYLGLALPGDLWDWDANGHAGWLLRGILRSCAARIDTDPMWK